MRVFLIVITVASLWILPLIEIAKSKNSDWDIAGHSKSQWLTAIATMGLFGSGAYFYFARPGLKKVNAKLIPGLGFIMCGLLVALGSVIFAESSYTSISSSPNSDQSASTTTPRRVDFAFGQSADFTTGMSLALTSVLDPVTDTQLPAAPHTREIGIVMMVTNASQSTQSEYLDSELSVLGSDGSTYSWNPAGFGSTTCPTDNGGGTRLLPTSHASVCTIFELPLGVKVKNVVVANAYWSTNR